MFTLVGFQTLKRDGLEVTGRGVFTVNAEMKVGTVQETSTVTSEAPVVDTQSVRRQTAISGEINELDFKVAKVLRFGRSRTNVGVEVYYALNRSSVLMYNQTLSINPATVQSSYLVPLTILTPRFVKFSAQFDF